MADPAFLKKNNERFYDALFVFLIVAFIIFKFNDLSLPYFWDELGVYSQAADYQFQHTISLMPNSVPDELSRGHPLFFTLINAIPLRLFGSHVFVAHVFNLCIATLLLVVFYLKISKHFKRLSGFSATTILVVQPVFLAQSALVIPEIMVSLFAFLALVFFYEEKYLLYVLFGSLVVLTKESGLVVPCAALTYCLFKLVVSKEDHSKFAFVKLLVAVVPLLVFGIFLLIQKQQNGWYFFPEHYDNIVISFKIIRKQFSGFFDFVFYAQERYWWLKILLIAIVISVLKNRLNEEGLKKGLLPLLVIFMFGFLLFSSLNFYMERYVVAAIAFAALLVGVSLEIILRNKFLVLIATFFLSVVAIKHLEENKFNYDCDLGYRRDVRTLQSAINYVSDMSGAPKKVFGTFPAYFALNFFNGGYMKAKNIIPKKDFRDDLDYVIIDALGTNNGTNRYYNKLKLIKTFVDGYSKVCVYEVIK